MMLLLLLSFAFANWSRLQYIIRHYTTVDLDTFYSERLVLLSSHA
jgi:hypothetical protein